MDLFNAPRVEEKIPELSDLKERKCKDAHKLSRPFKE